MTSGRVRVEIPVKYAIPWLQTGLVVLSIVAFVSIQVVRRIPELNPFESWYQGDFWATVSVALLVFFTGTWFMELRFHDRCLKIGGQLMLLGAVVIMSLKAHDYAYVLDRHSAKNHSGDKIIAKGSGVSTAEPTYLREFTAGGMSFSYELTAAQVQDQLNQLENDDDYAYTGRDRFVFTSGRQSPGEDTASEGTGGTGLRSLYRVPEPASGRNPGESIPATEPSARPQLHLPSRPSDGRARASASKLGGGHKSCTAFSHGPLETPGNNF